MNLAKSTFGLVLTGGGARGAYQAGVLEGISLCLKTEAFPFKILAGTSAGALNGSLLASAGADYGLACKLLCDIWRQLDFSQVFKTQPYSLTRLGVRWALGLTFGGVGMKAAPDHLLDTEPLQQFIRQRVNFEKLRRFEARGGVLAINATNYKSGAAVTFYSRSSDREDWIRSGRLSRAVDITADHILASSAIPVFFPPVKIGSAYYGDGAIRMKSPFSPAIHLGSEKILAIGVRKKRSLETLSSLTDQPMERIVLSDIIGVLLNAVFLDSLDADLERLERINRTLGREEKYIGHELKPIDVLVIQPSVDLGELAQVATGYFPAGVKYLLSGIGSKGPHGSDLSSYLAFHRSYTEELVELGIKDALARRDEIQDFFGKAPT